MPADPPVNAPEPLDPIWDAVRTLAPQARRAVALRYIADLPRFLGYARKVAGRYIALKPFLNLLDSLDGRQEEVGYTF